MEKTLDNTTADQAKDQVSDLKIWGNGDTFKLICKASSKAEGWMKSTKAMEIPGVGCVVQVTTQQMSKNGVRVFEYDEKGAIIADTNTGFILGTPAYTPAVAEAVTFVPGVKIKEEVDNENKVISRSLVAIS